MKTIRQCLTERLAEAMPTVAVARVAIDSETANLHRHGVTQHVLSMTPQTDGRTDGRRCSGPVTAVVDINTHRPQTFATPQSSVAVTLRPIHHWV